MAIESSMQELGVGLARIGISSTKSVAVSLGNVLISLRYITSETGDRYYKNWLKEADGKQFKKEENFMKVTYDQKKSDIERESVSNEDIGIIKNLCRKYGVDYFLAKRPDDIEELAIKLKDNPQLLNDTEKKIAVAFTFRDEAGNLVMNVEKPELPLISDDKYMLTIATKDIDRWAIICRKLEEKDARRNGFKDRIKKAASKAKSKNESFTRVINEIPGVRMK